jgi:hypothetical protein
MFVLLEMYVERQISCEPLQFCDVPELKCKRYAGLMGLSIKAGNLLSKKKNQDYKSSQYYFRIL